jgi:hypothetical protein
MSRIRILALGVLLLLGEGLSSPSLACPGCKEGVANAADPQAERVARGYSLSIYLMLGMPLVLITSGSVVLVRAARKGWLPEL